MCILTKCSEKKGELKMKLLTKEMENAQEAACEIIYMLEKQYEKDTLFCKLINETVGSTLHTKRQDYFEKLAELLAKEEDFVPYDTSHEAQEAVLPFILREQAQKESKNEQN
jgi:DNA polymerase IIIc chi subunit